MLNSKEAQDILNFFDSQNIYPDMPALKAEKFSLLMISAKKQFGDDIKQYIRDCFDPVYTVCNDIYVTSHYEFDTGSW